MDTQTNNMRYNLTCKPQHNNKLVKLIYDKTKMQHNRWINCASHEYINATKIDVTITFLTIENKIGIKVAIALFETI